MRKNFFKDEGIEVDNIDRGRRGELNQTQPRIVGIEICGFSVEPDYRMLLQRFDCRAQLFAGLD